MLQLLITNCHKKGNNNFYDLLVHTHTHSHTHIHSLTHIHMHSLTHSLTRIYSHTHNTCTQDTDAHKTHMHTHTDMHTYSHTHILTHNMHACTHIHKTYITHTHTQGMPRQKVLKDLIKMHPIRISLEMPVGTPAKLHLQ